MVTVTTDTTRVRTTTFVLALLLALVLQPLAPWSAAADPIPALPDEPQEAAETAAGWLALEFVDGERLEGEFGPDVGVTADAVFALATAGVARGVLLGGIDWLATQAPGYTRGAGFDAEDAVYAGATAKLILALLVDARDVRSVDGIDLVAQLEAREQADGRFTDTSDFGDFSSTLTQSLAVLALQRASDVSPSTAAVDLLLEQQCEDGGFRFDIGDEDGCTSSVDTTGFVVQALVAAGGAEATTAAEAATGWLVGVQDASGGYLSDDGVNANSTGLAAVGLALVPAVEGSADALTAARSYLLSLRTGCEGAAPGAFPFSADDAGDIARATTQAIPGLVGTGVASASAAEASEEVPALLPFDDVIAGGTHAPAICEVFARDAVAGFDERTFGSERSVTRGQAASVLAALLGLEPVESRTFSDVPADSRHAGAIAALVAADIVTGRSDGTFAPDQTLRRDQAASLLARALEVEPGEGQPFDDVTGDNVHSGSIAALAELGIVRGTTEDTFAPALDLRRDQFASLLVLAFPAEQDDGS